MSQCQLPGIGPGIEFQVARHDDLGHAQLLQTPGIACRLRIGNLQQAVDTARQRGKAQRLAQGLVAHARVGQHHRNVGGIAGRQNFRPDFGFHQQTQARPEGLDKAARRRSAVPGHPDLQITGLQQLLPFLASGRGAVGQQQPHARARLTQGLQQHSSRARFAQGHSMQPDPFAGMRRRSLRFLGRVLGETLMHCMQVQRLLRPTPAQLAQQQGPGQCHGRAVEGQLHGQEAFSAPQLPARHPASHGAAVPAWHSGSAPAPRACGPQSAAPAPAWYWKHGSGRSHPPSPHARRRCR